MAISSDVPDAQLGNPDGAWLRVISREASPIHEEPTSGDTTDGPAPNPGTSIDGKSGFAGQTEAPQSVTGQGTTSSRSGSWDAASTVAESNVPVSNVAASPRSGAPATSDRALAQAGVAAQRPTVIPARRRLSPPPMGTNVVGGSTVKLHRVAALDRLASGVGYLTVEWQIRRRGLDLLALQDGSTVAPRGNALTIDLTQPMNRVLVATGTQGAMPLAPTELRVSNGSTQVIVPIDGGTSLGVWPRLTLTRVDEFVVIRHERDPLSGMLDAVANAYGYDERSFVITHTHLLG